MSISVESGLRLLVLMAAIGLGGCQTTRGAWYFQREPVGTLLSRECDLKTRACLYLSVLNDTRKTLPLHRIRVYTSPASRLPFVGNTPETWSCERASDLREFELQPGQLVVVTLPHTGAAACRIPMHAELLAPDGSHLARVRIGSNQPDSIPASWLNCHQSGGGGGEQAESGRGRDGERHERTMPFRCSISDRSRPR